MSFFSNLLTAALIAVSGGTYAFYFAAASFALGTYADAEARSRKRRLQAEFKAGLKDRLQMVQGGTEARKLVYGRARISGPIVFAHSSGTRKEFLHLVVPLAGHESDAIETVYFGDVALPAEDGSGFIQSGEFFASATTTVTDSFSGTSKTLANTPTAILLITRESGSGEDQTSVVLTSPADYTLSGSTLTIPGGGTGPITYTYATGTPRVRIKKFLGSATQAASSDLVSEAGAKWTSAHQLKGITYLYSRLEFDQQVFAQAGLPNHSAVLRGRKVYDPRLDSTAGGSGPHRIATPSTWTWSDNAALCTADYLRDATYGMGATAAQTPAAELITAANICDEVVPLYTTGTVAVTNGSATVTGTGTAWLARVRPGMLFTGPNAVVMTIAAVASNTSLTLTAAYAGTTLSGQAYSVGERRYTANGVLDSADTARNNLDKLVEAMAGTVVWTQGRWLIRAGAHLSPSLTLTEDWLGDLAPQISPRAPRQELFNRVLATYAEREKLYTEVQAPPVANATYLADDGGLDLPVEVTYDLCTGGVRAQRLAKIKLERARQALTVRLSTNLRAYDLSPSDVVALTLARYGWSAKLFEVVQRTLDLQTRQVELLLRETAAGVWDWALGAETAIDLTPNTDLPNPFAAPAALTGMNVVSGTAQLLKLPDGTILTQALATWTQSTDVFVTQGGLIQVRWKLDSATEWKVEPSVPGNSVSAVFGPMDDRRVTLAQVRPVNSRGRVGPWTSFAFISVGKSAAPANVTSLAVAIVQGGARISWADNTEADYESTELRVGASWAAGSRLFRGNASSWTWLSPAQGTYTVWAKHWDTTGNESATAPSVSVVIDAAALIIIGAGQFTGTIGGGNLLANSSFEADSDANGLADSWTAFSSGTTGTITRSIVATGINGGVAQRISAAGLGTGTGDNAGVYQAGIPLANLVGRPVVFSVHAVPASAPNNPKGNLYVEFFNATPAVVGTISNLEINMSTSQMTRYSASGVVPAATITARAYFWLSSRPSSVGLGQADLDGCQFEIGDVATAYAPMTDELLPGVVGTTEIEVNAATSSVAVTAAAPTLTGNTSSATFGGTVGLLCQATWTNTTGETVQVECTMDNGGVKTSAAGGAYLFNSAATSAFPTGGTNNSDLLLSTNSTDVSATTDRRTSVSLVSVAAGQTCYAEALAVVSNGHTPAAAMTGNAITCRIAALKR